MSAQTFSDLRHEAFYRRMADEGVTIEQVHPPIPIRRFDFMAYKDPEGPCGTGASAEDAYLHLIELLED